MSAQHDLEHRDHDQAEHQHVERAPSLVDQHLVDHHLGEQRDDQGEELKEQRADQRFAEEPAETHDRGDEPGEIERPARADHAFARGHEDQFAGPAIVERRALLEGRPIGGHVLDQHGLVVGAGQQREGAVLHERDGREGRRFQSAWCASDAPRLHVQLPGGAQDVGGGEILAVGRELVAQLGRAGRLGEETQQRNERQHAAVRSLRVRHTHAPRHSRWHRPPGSEA